MSAALPAARRRSRPPRARASSSASRWLFARPCAIASSSVSGAGGGLAPRQRSRRRSADMPRVTAATSHVRACPVIRSMNTSSSEAAIGRTPSAGSPAARERRLDPRRSPRRRRRARRARGRDRRTTARPRTPGSPRARRPAGAACPAITSTSARRAHACSCRRRVERQQPALVQQRDARAPLRFVEVRRRHHDREAAREKLRQQLPELAPRHRDRRRSSARRAAGSCGSCTSVQASASFCFIPPDSRSARRARNGVSCVISSSRSRAAA